MSAVKFNRDELIPPSFLIESYICDLLKSADLDTEFQVRNKYIFGSLDYDILKYN